jgi:hypothetical protein
MKPETSLETILTNMFLTLLTLIAIFLIDGTLGKAYDSQRNNEDIFRNDSREMQRAKEMLWSKHSNFCTISLKSETNNRSAFERFSVPIPNDVTASTMSSFLSQLTVVLTSSFSHFHIPTNGLFLSMDHVPKDFPAITTLSFLQRYVPTTALQALSATTATTTVIKTPVSTTMTATTKAILIKLDNCSTNATSTATGLTSLNDITIAHVSATTATTTATMTQVPATATTNATKYQIDKCKAT